MRHPTTQLDIERARDDDAGTDNGADAGTLATSLGVSLLRLGAGEYRVDRYTVTRAYRGAWRITGADGTHRRATSLKAAVRTIGTEVKSVDDGRLLSGNLNKALRQLAGWSQDDLSAESGVSRRAIQDLEAGMRLQRHARTVDLLVETYRARGITFTQEDGRLVIRADLVPVNSSC